MSLLREGEFPKLINMASTQTSSKPSSSRFSLFISGLKHSMQLPVALFVIYGSERLSKNFVKSVSKSLILGFCCWILLLFTAWSRIESDRNGGRISSLWILVTGPDSDQIPSISSLAWTRPSTSLSSTIFMYANFLLNQSIYAQLSQRSFEIFTGTAPQSKKQSISRAIKQLYKNIFYASVFACILAPSLFLPSGSSSIFILMNVTSWILRLILHIYFMILLIFELKGSNRGWEFNQILAYIQVNWIYFAGFAAIPSFISFVLFDVILSNKGQVWKLVKLVLLSLLFPLYIVISSRSHPPQTIAPLSDSSPFLPRRLPIFYVPEQLATLIIRILKPA